jgi:hypothetical protein
MNTIKDLKIGDLVRLPTSDGYLTSDKIFAIENEGKGKFDDGIYLGCVDGTYYFAFKEYPIYLKGEIKSYNSVPLSLSSPFHNFKYIRLVKDNDYRCRIIDQNKKQNIILTTFALGLISSTLLGKKLFSAPAFSHILKQNTNDKF